MTGNSLIPRVALASAALLFLWATDARAQENNQSDVTGVVVSGSEVAGGVRSITLTIPTIPSPAAVTTLRATIAQAALNATTGPTPAQALADITAAPSAAGAAPAAAPAVTLPAPVAAVLGCAGQCAPQMATLSTALQAGGAVPAAPVQALTASINDLASGATMSPPQLAAAITTARTAFQGVIEKADAAYLSNPPKEIVAIHKLLVSLITAANAK
jgi:hypothetical protein